ncbi:MAG: OmpA family protein [Nitratireductor sp.]
MINRRNLLLSLSAALTTAALPATSMAQASPSALKIERSLSAAPSRKLSHNKRILRKELRRRKDIRDLAPSIDLQDINFEFGSARIPRREFWKIENIADAMHAMGRRRSQIFLIEGHTDAVGSHYNNQKLSQARARSLKRILVRNFGIEPWTLETIGFGEEYLLVPTLRADWRNRRVTLRRVTDLIR